MIRRGQDEGKGHSRLLSQLYQEDLRYCASLPLPWKSLDQSTIMVSGATGMIGTFLIDMLMTKMHDRTLDCHVVALGRDMKRAQRRFPYFSEPWFSFEQIDISSVGGIPTHRSDITIHLASVTHPRGYATDPIGTITSNVMGLSNLLEHRYRGAHGSTSVGCNDFLFASSVEIYGEDRGERRPFAEDYCGYINSNTLRAGYPESKRLGESLCQAYLVQSGIKPVIARISRTYGPTLHRDDSKALSQFLHRGLSGQDIVLKSLGNQLFSYMYVADVVAALLYCLTTGGSGEAYNVSDSQSDVHLRDLAHLVAAVCDVQLRVDVPDEIERSGYSKAQYAVMDASKLQKLGWSAHYSLLQGIERTVHIVRGTSAM